MIKNVGLHHNIEALSEERNDLLTKEEEFLRDIDTLVLQNEMLQTENGDMQVGIKSSEKKNDDLQSSLKAMGETCEELEKEIKHLHNEMEVFHKSGNIIQDQCDTAKE